MTNSLTKNDLENFANNFITDEMAIQNGIYRVDSIGGAETIGRKPSANSDLSGLIFPYFLPEETNAREYRLRLNNPPKDDKGKETAKYLTAKGSKPMFYFPFGITNEMLTDVDLRIVMCEGEKKSLALMRVATNDFTGQPQFIPLGISGVWNWTATIKGIKGETPDFGLIEWKDRKVTILFDADKSENYLVASAENRLAKHLKSKGSNVFICSLPKVENNKGIDDLLGFWEREHDTATAINKCFELFETSKEFEANKFYLPNDLSLDFANGERGKAKLTVFRDKEILHVDEISLTKAKDRESFIAALGLSDNEEIKAANQCLMQLAMLKPQNETKETASEEKFILSQILSDGRILEALSTKQIAIYSPETDSVEYAESVIFDGIRYLPLSDDVTKDGLLVDAVENYSSESDLVNEIESYISRHYDLDLRELKLSAYYILLTYLIDVLFEVPYLPPARRKWKRKNAIW